MSGPERSEEVENGRRRAPPESETRPERTYPNCGALLLEQKCKLLCPNRACGYYMSCSDFYQGKAAKPGLRDPGLRRPRPSVDRVRTFRARSFGVNGFWRNAAPFSSTRCEAIAASG